MASLSTFNDGDRLDRIGPDDWSLNASGLWEKQGTKAFLFRQAEVGTFPALTDTPNSYSGLGGQFLRVNVGETAVEAVNMPVLIQQTGWPAQTSTSGPIPDTDLEVETLQDANRVIQTLINALRSANILTS